MLSKNIYSMYLIYTNEKVLGVVFLRNPLDVFVFIVSRFFSDYLIPNMDKTISWILKY